MKRLLAIIFSVSLIYVMLISSAEIVCYGTPGWFEHEYEKYDVLDNLTKEMDMKSVLDVTDELMKYLRGGRDDLVVYSERDGVRQEFFTDREKAHMADVKVLFMGGLWSRNILAIICILIVLIIYKMHKRDTGIADTYIRSGSDPIQDTAEMITRTYTATACAMLVIAGIIGALFASDFTRYFTIFHEIFFDNDLWILYYDKDDVINLLPEGFFIDTATRILVIFLLLLIATMIFAVIISRRYRKAVRDTA